MIAVILAAGMSTRLRPLTNTKPKCLLDVGDTTLLTRYLDILEAVGIEKTIIVTGFNQEAVAAEAHKKERTMDIECIINDNYSLENNHPIHGFLLIEKYITDDFLLLNSDIFFSEKVLQALVDSPQSCVAIDSTQPFVEDEMYVNYLDDGRVEAISKQLIERDTNQGRSVQVVKFKHEDAPALFDRARTLITENTPVYPAQAYDALIQNNTFYIVDVAGEFTHELDTVEDYESLMSHLTATV